MLQQVVKEGFRLVYEKNFLIGGFWTHGRVGGTSGHSFDLMALDSYAVIGRSGSLLPHFTPFPSSDSRGVNLFSQNLLETEDMSNPYVFPPFGLVGPVLKFFYSFQIPLTIVVPEPCPYPYWWP